MGSITTTDSFELLSWLENFFDHFPYSFKTVSIAMAVLCIVLVLLWREIWAWYTKVGPLRSEVRDMRAQLGRIEAHLESIVSHLQGPTSSAPTEHSEQTKVVELKVESHEAKKFPIVR